MTTINYNNVTIDTNYKINYATERKKDKTILITGAAGYIGSVLIPELLKHGHKVIALDNFLYNQQSSLLDCCFNKNLEIIRGDVRNENLMSDLIKNKDLDFIIPLAAYVGPICDRFPLEARSVNLDSIRQLLNYRNRFNRLEKIKIIYPCTNSGYGIGQNIEGKSVYCTEETELNPISLYGKLKVEAESHILNSKNSISLRLATVMGCSPFMRLDLLVNDIVYRALNDRFVGLYEQNAKRNYIHVRDVCKAFIHSIEKFDKMKNEIYNVGLSSANLSKLELCQEIKKQIPEFNFVEIEGQDPDKRDYIVSNEKLEKTGWYPEFTLEDSIKELIKGYQIIKNK